MAATPHAREDTGIGQDCLGLGEPRGDDGRPSRIQPRQHRETLSGPRQQQHLVGRATMPFGDGVDSALLVLAARITAQLVQPRREPIP